MTSYDKILKVYHMIKESYKVTHIGKESHALSKFMWSDSYPYFMI